MSREEIRHAVTDFYAALRDGDVATAPVHDDLVIHEPAALPYGGTYYRLEQQRTVLFPRIAQVLDLSRLRLLDIVADDDEAVATLRVPVTGTGAELMLAEHHRLEGGRIKEVRVFVYDFEVAPVQTLFPKGRPVTH
jgi:hypothetical protein